MQVDRSRNFYCYRLRRLSHKPHFTPQSSSYGLVCLVLPVKLVGICSLAHQLS